MTTIYREYDTNSRSLKVLNPSVSGGVRGDDNSLKIQFIYTDDTYLEDKKAYIVFDVVDPDTQNLYTFSEDTTPKFDGYVFTVPAELLQMKGITNGYIHFQLGFIGLSDSLGDVEFSQSQIDYLEFNAANTLILRDTLASDLSQAPTYYAWAEYYKEHGLLDKIEKEETENGCIIRYFTYSGESFEVPLNYVKLDSEGHIADSIFPKITVTDTHKRLAGISGNQRDALLKLTLGPTYGAFVEEDPYGNENITYYITMPTENGQASITTYYVAVDELVGDGTTDTRQVWYQYDPLTKEIKVVPRIDEMTGEPVIGADGEPETDKVVAEELTATDRAELIKAGHESTEGAKEVYGYTIRSTTNGDSVPVFYIIDTETGAYAYYTYEDEIASDGVSVNRTWYKCDENGVADTYTVITETTEVAFEEKENKIQKWSEYSESYNGQYPSAKLVYDTFQKVGKPINTLLPYSYAGAQAITGKDTVESGAIFDAIENEATARKVSDRKLRGDLNETTATLTQLRSEFDADHIVLATTKSKADGHDTAITALNNKVTDCETLTENTASELRKELTDNVEKYFIDSEEHKSVLTLRLNDAITQLDNTVSNTTRSLYQQMNLLKEEVNSNLVSSITDLKTDVSGLKSATTAQETNISSLTQSFTALSDTVKNMGDNLSIDFNKYDLVTIDKSVGTIDESLLPDTAITEYFGPVDSRAKLTSVQRKKTIAKVTKVPLTEPVTEMVDVTPEPVPVDRYVLLDCPVTYQKKIGNEKYEITKEVYSVEDDGTLAIKYWLSPQYEDSAYAFYDGTQANGVALPKFYASRIIGPTPKYTIFQGTTSNALYSLSSKVVSTRTEVKTVAEKQYNSDGSVKLDADGAPVVIDVEKEVIINTYEFTLDTYGVVGKPLLTGVADKALGAVYPSGQVDLKELSDSTGSVDVYRFYAMKEQEPVFEERPVLGSDGKPLETPKTDALGAIIYDTEDHVRMVDPLLVPNLSVIEENARILPRNILGNVYRLVEDGVELYLTPKPEEDYEAGTVVGYKSFKIGTESYTCTKVNKYVGGVKQDVCEFYVVDGDLNGDYTIQKTVKTITTYSTEWVYPQRGDMCVVRNSVNPKEDGVYLLGLSDFDGHTYSSVVEHWVKLESPQSNWGQIFGDIDDQTDLQALLADKSVKFDAVNGVTLEEDVATGVFKLGHTATSGDEYGMGTFDKNNIKALGVRVDKFGHVQNMEETIVYPPTLIGAFEEQTEEGKTGFGSEYWGSVRDAQGKNVCDWVRPISTLQKDSYKLVTSAGIYQALMDVKSQAIGEAKGAVSSKQNTLSVLVMELGETSWNADGTNGYKQDVTSDNNKDVISSSNYLITFDTQYLEEAIRCGIRLDSSPSPKNGWLRFRADAPTRGSVKVNVLVIPSNAS